MTDDALLRDALAALQVNDDYSEAVLEMSDGSRLRLCHRVGERWAKCEKLSGVEAQASLADRVLARLASFRLNGKHLDIQFQDGSRWETLFRG